MEKYIDLAGLFEFSDEWDISFDEENECVVIDNIYKNPLEILSWLKSQDYPLWKYVDPEKTRNTKEYLDCRLNHAWPYNYGEEDMVAIENVCKKYLGRQKIDVLNRAFEFNCFKDLEKKSNTEQHFPHLDDDQKIPDEWSTINMITYMDQGGNGGTNIYDYDFPDNIEHENLFFKLEKKHKIVKSLEHKFNRAVLFRGNKWHGAFIEDYEHYMKNWRYSQVYFIK